MLGRIRVSMKIHTYTRARETAFSKSIFFFERINEKTLEDLFLFLQKIIIIRY